MGDNGPEDITEPYRVRSEFTTVVATSTGTVRTVTENENAVPRPVLLAEGGVDVFSLRFDAPNACENIGCTAVIELTDLDGNVISDRNPNNDTVRVVDGVIVQG